eukprot:753883-Hanusia_phi.AAC.2
MEQVCHGVQRDEVAVQVESSMAQEGVKPDDVGEVGEGGDGVAEDASGQLDELEFHPRQAADFLPPSAPGKEVVVDDDPFGLEQGEARLDGEEEEIWTARGWTADIVDIVDDLWN